MRRLLTLSLMVLALMGLSASAATADGCACGGGWAMDRTWHDYQYGGGHYDCLWYRTEPPWSYYVVHGC